MSPVDEVNRYQDLREEAGAVLSLLPHPLFSPEQDVLS